MLTGKVSLITGASSGIGAATAKLFAKSGAPLVLAGRKRENLQKVVEECKQFGSNELLSVPCDLTNESDVKNLVDVAIQKYGQLDVLVNNAGILERGSIEATSLEQYDRLMNMNVRSIYHLTMLCVPHLLKTKGSIVNVSSVNGMRAFPGVLAYNVSKAAVDHFTRCVALELADRGVRVNSVNPGVTITELHKRGGQDEGAYAKFLEHSKTTHALGRVGRAEEIAEAILFLASASSSFTTGASIPCDGGRHAMCPR